MIKNEDVVHILDEIADILELKGENKFQINAFRKAARTIDGLLEDISVVAEEERLKELPGIGEGIAKKIIELLEDGELMYYEDLKRSIPSGLLEMIKIQGLGPNKVRKLYEELGIEDIEALKTAAMNKKLRGLTGFGAKTEENIIKGIEQYRKNIERVPIGIAMLYAESIIANLKDLESVSEITYAGSLRRMRETIGDIDILISSQDSRPVIDAFIGLKGVSNVLARGDTKSSVIMNGIHVDLRVIKPDSFGAALQYFTGSKEHNVRLRDLALRRGLKVNEYGVYQGEEKIAGVSEEGIYQSIGLGYIPPELREDKGEIEAALRGDLPDLIELGDIKGDLHIHSDYSDGKRSIEEMARAAKSRGYEYIVISDHSPAVTIASGPSREDLKKQIKIIRDLNRDFDGFRIFTSTEVDIRPDSSLDFDDDILGELEIVVAAVHSKFSMDEDSMTDRIISAIKNPNVDILAHPTGRLLGRRDPYKVNMKRVIDVAKRTDTVLELNASPRRLDLNDMHCKQAVDAGIKIAISTDSHDTYQMAFMKYGIGTARRAWLKKEDVVNTRSLESLIDFFEIEG
ncbi:MAG: DNA polymerase/3'-5' exonuclease PolX [Halobacteriota archaeon]|nr:DNA polymerase/3'-5' exonuclease PolX [Halobacteriota archaeon]